MTIAQTAEQAARKPLRLWPGVVIVLLQWLARFGIPVFAPEFAAYGVFGGLVGGLAIVVWWVFLSRAPWSERLGAILLMIVALFATSPLLHESIAKGAMGMLFPILAIPILSLAFVAWAVASRRLADGPRRAALAATILLACAVLTLVRTGGFTGNFDNDLNWRWAKTPEERLLAQVGDEPKVIPPAPAASAIPMEPPMPRAGEEPLGAARPSTELGTTLSLPSLDSARNDPESVEGSKGRGRPAALSMGPAASGTAPADPLTAMTEAEWPGFRGLHRDDIVRGVRITTDWSTSPPVEMWRRPIGPGWSSFSVRGDFLYTQEQRGDDEIVASYKVSTGEPVWKHRDTARFWESNGGAGPRGTPTLSGGRVYTLGATGIVNALDARDGTVVWSRNAASDTGAKLPDWGFAGSPLVVGDVVIVAASGALVAYNVATGEPRWFGPVRGASYSSPHLLTIDGVEQILLLSEPGASSVALADGTLLWEHAWPGYPIVQPAVTAGGDVLMSVSNGTGTRRLAVAHGPGGWTVDERWRSNGLKPNFNDFVVHEGHAFGFDGNILACIDLEDGKRKWKGGRYGNGQLVLLPDQDLLLVLSEEGELALVAAAPDQFKEFARFPAIEGKTWNHPVLVGNVLLVRNGEEMAAFRLSLSGR